MVEQWESWACGEVEWSDARLNNAIGRNFPKITLAEFAQKTTADLLRCPGFSKRNLTIAATVLARAMHGNDVRKSARTQTIGSVARGLFSGKTDA